MNYKELIRDLVRFRNQVKRFNEYSSRRNNILMYRYFFNWRRLKKESDTLKYKLPWISMPAISYLKNHLKRDMKVFEFGAGGSSLFFANLVSFVTSVEHNIMWHKKLSQYIIKNKINNLDLNLIEPFPESNIEKEYKSADENYKSLSFKLYAESINNYPNDYFDVIVIDGRARVGCFQNSISKIKKGGIIIWDNSERDRYRQDPIFNNNNFKRIEMPGPTPFSMEFTLTTIFKN